MSRAEIITDLRRILARPGLPAADRRHAEALLREAEAPDPRLSFEQQRALDRLDSHLDPGPSRARAEGCAFYLDFMTPEAAERRAHALAAAGMSGRAAGLSQVDALASKFARSAGGR